MTLGSEANEGSSRDDALNTSIVSNTARTIAVAMKKFSGKHEEDLTGFLKPVKTACGACMVHPLNEGLFLLACLESNVLDYALGNIGPNSLWIGISSLLTARYSIPNEQLFTRLKLLRPNETQLKNYTNEFLDLAGR